jgi:hypothetical protein
MLAKISLLDADNPLGGSTESSFLLLNEKQKKTFHISKEKFFDSNTQIKHSRTIIKFFAFLFQTI